MASQPDKNREQMMLFTVDQERRADGSFIVRTNRIVDDREISVRQAAKMLGFCTKTIYALRDQGEITGWKKESLRGNQPYRISWLSVMEYKERRKRDCR